MWWPALLKDLHTLDISWQLIGIMRDYLKDREVEHISQSITARKHLTEGCPQGTKTRYILFSGLSSSRNPVVRFQGNPVRRATSYKYLGVIIDENKCFRPHLEYVTGKARAIFQTMRKYTQKNWGSSREALATIYRVAKIPIIAYAKLSPELTEQHLTSLFHLEIERITAIKQMKKNGNTELMGGDLEVAEYRYWIAARMGVDARCINRWQSEWDRTEKGRCTHELISNISEWIGNPTERFSRVTCSFFTNFKVHLHRIGKIASPNCERCNQADTPAHRLMICPVYNEERAILIDSQPRRSDKRTRM
ncbi:hypothetical protein JTB14_015357 [Gonioctena quinquepunctata]|nr:hypothetical protein JTB14_015357 [Gonioctena quinquepunctata]